MKTRLRSPGFRLATPAFIIGAALLLTACATRQLAPDFAAISDAYARNMNRQMLLNLARLDQGHPAYFMAIGEVRVARTQGTSLQGGTNSSHNRETTTAAAITERVTNVLTGNLAGSGQAGVSPTFVFIPINSEEASRQLLSPIPVEVFATLYEQGWPVDQLLRVLVERIEVRFDDPERKPIIMVNSPTRASAEACALFLRTADVVRRLQQAGGLSLAAEKRFEPLAPVSLDPATLSLRDITDASEEGYVWRRQPSRDGASSPEATRLQIGRLESSLSFRADRQILAEILRSLGLEPDDPALAQKSPPPVDGEARLYQTELRRRELENLRAVFRAGLVVTATSSGTPADDEHATRSSRGSGGADVREGRGPRASGGGGGGGATRSEDGATRAENAGGRAAGTAGRNGADGIEAVDATGAAREGNISGSGRGVHTILILRSFKNMLEAVAQEQRAFDELAQRTDFLAGLPARQQRPVLRTDWSGRDDELVEAVTEVTYGEHDYRIADPAGLAAASLESRWNRDIFRLLINLSSQVTVDITKFQRQVLELTP